MARRSGQQRLRRKAVQDPVAVPAPAGMTREPFFWILPVVAAAYALLAWVMAGQAERWALGVVDGQQLFAIDDAWRYFLARTAWQDGSLYQWSYMLPVATVADGILATLANGNLWLMRTAHVLPAVATLCLVYLTGRRLGAGRAMMTTSTLLLACMPLFAFVSISFYGENWLALLLAAGAWCFVAGRERTAAFVFALLPLVRPEGIFLIAPLGLYWLLRRRVDLLLLLGGPGLFYGLYLLAVLEHPDDYTRWRIELLAILQHAQIAGMRRAGGFLDVFNIAWTLPALAAFCMPALRGAWPLFAGAALWLVAAILFVVSGNSFFEARYFVSILPLLAIAWPFFFTTVAAHLQQPAAKRGILAAFYALSLAVTAEHLLQVDPWKAAWGNQRWPVPGIPAARTYFGTLSPRALAVREDTAQAVAAIVRGNPAIERVLITQTELFYHLDPDIARLVDVVYVPTNEATANAWLHGSFFGIRPDDHPYAWYRLRDTDSDAPRNALFVGRLDNRPAAYRNGIFAIHLVALEQSTRNPAIPATTPTASAPAAAP